MRSRDFLVGLTFFGLLTILAVSTIFFADFTFTPQFEMKVLFENAGGLFEGAEVRVDGLASGRVRGLERVRERNVIRATLMFEERPVLYSDVVIQIAAASPLGGTVVDIDSGRRYLPVLDEKEEPVLDEDGRPKLVPNTEYVPESEESLERLWTGPQATIGDAIASIQETASEIDTFVARLNEEKVPAKLGDITRNVAKITEDLLLWGSALDMIVGEDSAEDVRNTLRKLSFLAGEVAKSGGTLDLVLGVESAKSVRDSLDQIDAITKELAEAESGLAWLLGNPEEAEKVLAAIGNIKEATADIREHTTRIAEAESGLEWLLGSEDSVAEVRDVVKSLKGAAADIKLAAGWLRKEDGIIQMLLTDASAKKEVRNSIKALSDFIETTRENAPITTFAGIILSPF